MKKKPEFTYTDTNRKIILDPETGEKWRALRYTGAQEPQYELKAITPKVDSSFLQFIVGQVKNGGHPCLVDPETIRKVYDALMEARVGQQWQKAKYLNTDPANWIVVIREADKAPSPGWSYKPDVVLSPGFDDIFKAVKAGQVPVLNSYSEVAMLRQRFPGEDIFSYWGQVSTDWAKACVWSPAAITLPNLALLSTQGQKLTLSYRRTHQANLMPNPSGRYMNPGTSWPRTIPEEASSIRADIWKLIHRLDELERRI